MGAPKKVREWPTHGKRYYIIDIEGYRIVPGSDFRSAAGGYRKTTTYAVLDRDMNHREMGVFIPEARGASSARCKRQAEILCAYLNQCEELATNGAAA